MISASKSTLSLNNLMILRPKVTKILTNLRKKFYESPPRSFRMMRGKNVDYLESENKSPLMKKKVD
jgi:hypothetical protein